MASARSGSPRPGTRRSRMTDDHDPGLDALRTAIAGFGAEEAPEIVARARAEARERATSLLSDAMTRALLDSARRELGEPPEDPRPARPQRTAAPQRAPRHDEVAH